MSRCHVPRDIPGALIKKIRIRGNRSCVVMRDSSWQGGVTFGTSAAFRRHVGPLPSARGGPPFSCVGKRRLRPAISNDESQWQTRDDVRTSRCRTGLFALKISISGNYADVCPLHFEREERGEGAQREETVADRPACVTVSFSISIICPKKSVRFLLRSIGEEKKLSCNFFQCPNAYIVIRIIILSAFT